MMKKLKLITTGLFILSFFIFPSLTRAEEKINLYFFYGDGCPHCAKEEVFLDQLEKDKANINIYRYETWHDRDNQQLLSRLGKELGVNIPGVPMLFIGDKTITGYYNDDVTGSKILDIINEYEKEGCSDIVAPIIGLEDRGQCVHGCDLNDAECLHDCGCSADTNTATQEIPDTINIPFFGLVETANVSLPIFTVLIAAADGFNPCAMWVLLFLISLLLGMQDKKRMWILGSAFIVASALVYFLFLTAWLSLFIFLGFILWVRIAIGLVALVSGGWHLRDAWRNREGNCEVVGGSDKRKKIFSKLRNLAGEKKFWIALGGIVALAFAVNLVELLCSAGLPAVYTQVLALSDLAAWQYYGYLTFYIFIFMLDDLLVFILAMTTLQMKAISSRYTKWAGWIGGIIMLIVGILLLFKPGWLMFG